MMNQEEKKLLLIDLCARLPYDNTYVQYTGDVPTGLGAVKLNHEIIKIIETLPEELNITVKPYLRPMSSMTEEEMNELKSILPFPNGDIFINCDEVQIFDISGDKSISWHYFYDVINWLNSHHFDYRGLIEKGLAIDSTNKYYTSNEKI